jgi:hypothetical protein
MTPNKNQSQGFGVEDLSHHSRFHVTCECDEREINDDDNDDDGGRIWGTGAACLGNVVLKRAELCHLIEVVARRHVLLDGGLGFEVEG